jgi:hypothetical protein
VIGKVIAMWMPILVFVYMAFEHSVVNMFLFPVVSQFECKPPGGHSGASRSDEPGTQEHGTSRKAATAETDRPSVRVLGFRVRPLAAPE